MAETKREEIEINVRRSEAERELSEQMRKQAEQYMRQIEELKRDKQAEHDRLFEIATSKFEEEKSKVLEEAQRRGLNAQQISVIEGDIGFSVEKLESHQLAISNMPVVEQKKPERGLPRPPAGSVVKLPSNAYYREARSLL